MSGLRVIVLQTRTSSGKHDLSYFTNEKWKDVEANITREFPDDGPAFSYRNNDGEEAAVYSDETLKKFVEQISDRADSENDRKAVVQVKLLGIREAQALASRSRGGQAGGKDDKIPKATPMNFPSSASSYVIYKPVSSWASSSVTIAMFVRCSNVENKGCIFSYASRSHADELCLFQPASLKLIIKQQQLEPNVALDEGKWYHVAVTWSEEGQVDLYLNGDRAFSARGHRVGAQLSAGGSFVLGDRQEAFGAVGGGEHSFGGELALVSVWKAALKRDAVRAMALSPATKGSEHGLCLYWDFARAKGMEVLDGLDPEDGRRRGQIKEGAAAGAGPVPLRGGGGAAGGRGGWQGKKIRAHVLRFEEGSRGRVAVWPSGETLHEELTAMLWVCSADTLSRGTLLSWAAAHPERGMLAVTVRDCADLAITVGSPDDEVRTHTSVADGTWHHVAVTWRRDSSRVALLVDGEERFSALVPDVDLGAGSAPHLVLGQLQWPTVGTVHRPGRFFGLLGEVSVWSRALSQGDVRKRMTTLQKRADTGLAIYLDVGAPEFEDGVIPDVSENDRRFPGRIVGGVNRLEDLLLYPGAPCPEALPVLDRQVAAPALALDTNTLLAILHILETPFPIDLSDAWNIARNRHEQGKTGRLCVPRVTSIGGAELSVSLWFKANAKASSRESTLVSYDCGPWAEQQFCIQDCANLSVTMFEEKPVKTSKKTDDGGWHFLALTWRSLDGQTVLYVDCQRVWEGKLGQGKRLLDGGSLWVGQGHQWNLPKDSMEADIPHSLVPAVANCSSKEEALELLAGGEGGDEQGERWTREFREALRPAEYSGGEFGPKQVYDLIMVASMRTHALVGEVALITLWTRALQLTDVQQASSGVLHGGERGLAMVLDAARFDGAKQQVEDWVGGVHARVSGSYRVTDKQVLRQGVEWELGPVGGGHGRRAVSVVQFLGDKSYVMLPKFKDMPSVEVSVSVWVRSSDTTRRGAVLSYAVGTADKAKEFALHDHTNLSVYIKARRIATGLSLADGAWHHLVVTWTSAGRCQELGAGTGTAHAKAKAGKIAAGGEVQVFMDGERVLCKGQQGEVSLDDNGTLAIGEELGGVKGDFTASGSFVGEIAELSIWERRLDDKDVHTLFRKIGMPDHPKGVKLHWDFAGDGPTVQDRSGGGWHGKLVGMEGPARLLELKGVYQVQPTTRETEERGGQGVKAKALEFVGRGEGYIEVFPFREMPKEAFTVAFWMRTTDRSKNGTPVSYAASLQQRISFECTFNRKTITIRVDPAMSFEKLIQTMTEKFGKEVTFEYAELPAGVAKTTVCTEEQFEELRGQAYRLGFETLPVSVVQVPTKELNMQSRGRVAKTAHPEQEPRELVVQHVRPPVETPSRGASPEEVQEIRQREELLQEEQRLQVAVKGQGAMLNRRVRLSDGRWHHVAVTWRSMDGRTQVVVDGCVVCEETGQHKGGRLHAGGYLVVGQGQLQMGPPFEDASGFVGHVAEICMWSRALPGPRIQKLMGQRLSGLEQGLVLLWNFQDNPLLGRREVFNAVIDEDRDEGREEKGRVKGAQSVRWEEVVLPGDRRGQGLGRPTSKQDRIIVTIKSCSGVKKDVLNGIRNAELFFLHLSFHDKHKVTDHVLLHGGFAVHRDNLEALTHQQVLYVDDVGSKQDRDILAAKLQAEHAELQVRIELCTEKTTRDGQVLTEEVATAHFDLIDILDRAADFVDKKISLLTAAQDGGPRAELCSLTVDVDALAALRALSVKQDPKKSAAAKGEEADLKRFVTNYSRTAVGQAALSKVRDKKGDSDSREGVVDDRASRVSSSSREDAYGSAGAGRFAGRRPSRESMEMEQDVDSLVQQGRINRRASSGAEVKKSDAGVQPSKMVLLCRESAAGGRAGKLVRVEMEWEVLWSEFQSKIEGRFGPGFAVEHRHSGGKPIKIATQKVFELWHMQVEDDVLSGKGDVKVDDSGEATLQVSIVPIDLAAQQSATSQGGAKSDEAHDRGADPDDNPEEYVFKIDCSQLQKSGGGKMGTVTIRVSPEVVWEDFYATVVSRFGIAVSVEYTDSDSKWVMIKGYDDFNDCCDLIEEQWDDGGDGSMAMRVSERRRVDGEQTVEERVGYSRLPVGEARRVNQRKVDGVAADLFAFKRRVVHGLRKTASGAAAAQEVTKAFGKNFKLKESVREAAERLMWDDAVLEVQWEAVRPPPPEYVFRCDCTALRAKKTGRRGPVSVRTGTDVMFADFLQALVSKFEKGEEVSVAGLTVSYEVEHKGQTVWKVIAGEEEFVKCCALIETQWEGGGDGSMHLEVKPKKKETDDKPASQGRRASVVMREAAAVAADRQVVRRSKVIGTSWGVDLAAFQDRFRLLTPDELTMLERLQDPVFMSACLSIFRHRKLVDDAVTELDVGCVTAEQWVKAACSVTGLPLEPVRQVLEVQRGRRDAKADFRALASELVAADVGGMLRRSRSDEVAMQVLRRRGALRRRLGTSADRGGLMELDVAVKAVVQACGVETVAARRLLLESGAVLVVEREVASKRAGRSKDAEGSAEDKVHVVKVGVVCWRRVLDGLAMLHPAEVQVLEYAREHGRQKVRRAVLAKKEAVLRGLKAAGGEGGKPQAWEVIDQVCSEQSVECGKSRAREMLEEARGRKDVKSYVQGLQWVDTERGTLAATVEAIAGRIPTVTAKCRDEPTACPGVLLKYGFTQALQASSLELDKKQTIVDDAAPVNEWGVDYKELFHTRLCVMSERERKSTVLPWQEGGQCALDARLWVQENAAELAARLEDEDQDLSGQVDAEVVKRVVLDLMPGMEWSEMESTAGAMVDEVAKWGAEGDGGGTVSMESLRAALQSGERMEGVPFYVTGGAAQDPQRVLKRLEEGGGKGPAVEVGLAKKVIAGEIGEMWKRGTEWAAESLLRGMAGWEAKRVHYMDLLRYKPMSLRPGAARVQQAVDQVVTLRDVLMTNAAKVDRGLGLVDYDEMEIVAVESLSQYVDTAPVRALLLTAERDAGAGLVDPFRFFARFCVVPEADLGVLSQVASRGQLEALTYMKSCGEKERKKMIRAGTVTGVLRELEQDQVESDVVGMHERLGVGHAGECSVDAKHLLFKYVEQLQVRYTALQPAQPPADGAKQAGDLVGISLARRVTSAHVKGVAKTQAAVAQGAPTAGAGKGLTRGQQVFKKLLASMNKRPGLAAFLEAMGGMPPTCVPTPLATHAQRLAPPVAAPSEHPPLCFQFVFEAAEGVPDPGAKFVPTARSLQVCLFDVFHMRFVGLPRALPLAVPKDKSKPDALCQWRPDKAADATVVSAELAGEEQLHLYLELQQSCAVKGADGAPQRVSCGFALLPLKDLAAPAAGSRWSTAASAGPPTGKKELAVSGGTPFIPRAIDKSQLPGGKTLAARLLSFGTAGKGPMTKMVLKLEKPDKPVLAIAQSRLLPVNSVCAAVSAVPIAHFHALRSAAQRGPLEALFSRAAAAEDPVLALFPKVLRDAETMQHFNALWKQRADKLGSKDRDKPDVMQRLVRDCTLAVWPLLQVNRPPDATSAAHAEPRRGSMVADKQEASVKSYMESVSKAKGAQDMQKVMAGETKGSAVPLLFQPFRIDEFVD